MANEHIKAVTMLLSIVERGKAPKLIKTLNDKKIYMHYQCVGFGTAPTEMMDIFGLGSNDKDVVISLGAQNVITELMSDFSSNFNSYSEYGGLMIVIKLSAINRIAAEILNHNIPTTTQKGAKHKMKNEHNHNLILITVSQGYADQVMQTAKRAGATGGTVLRGRLAESETFLELAQTGLEEEREIICILAPSKVSRQIMEDVNREFGLTSEAHGTVCAVPVEKAYKI